MHRRLAGCVALAVTLGVAGTALADVDVSFAPLTQNVNIAAGSATVDIVADIPAADAIIGWGLDLSLTGGTVSLTDVAVNELLFDAIFAPDLDGLAAIVPADSIFGSDIVLATLTFSLDAMGPTTLSLSYTSGDLTEGFPRDPAGVGGFANAVFTDGEINVIPEPASAFLVALAALGLRRRA